jgi:hypothetical protein
MKLILICWFAVIMPMLHSNNNKQTNNDSKNSAARYFDHTATGNPDLPSFKENKILIKEFSDIIKDHRGALINSKAESSKKTELMPGFTVD